jgi:hypothetical protein
MQVDVRLAMDGRWRVRQLMTAGLGTTMKRLTPSNSDSPWLASLMIIVCTLAELEHLTIDAKQPIQLVALAVSQSRTLRSFEIVLDAA